jgi:hypothetical protein
MRWTSTSSILLVILLVAGAGLLFVNRIEILDAPDPASIEQASPADTQSPDDLADALPFLQALGYVEYDHEADAQLSGVTHIDAARVAPGYGLYTDDRQTARLIDAHGRVVHEWHAPPDSGRCEFAQLLANDMLALVCLNQSVTFLDWNSRMVGRTLAHAHHEAAPIGTSSVLVPVHEEHDYRGRKVIFDAIMKISPDAPPTRVWGTWDALAELQALHAPLPMDTPLDQEKTPTEDWLKLRDAYDYYHLNSIQVLPDTPLGQSDTRFQPGNLMVSLRNANLVVILDRDDHSIVWSWGPGEIELQHHPRMLANGHVLIFDNGRTRRWSRVIELDPALRKVVWEYRDEEFFSAWRGSSQRLENGNTLICQSESGRVFEVDPAGDVVWEFWNPDFAGPETRRLIYRFLKVPADRIERLVAAHAGTAILGRADASPDATH